MWPGRWQSISKLKPREYQKRAVKEALRRERLAVIMPTGAGKTLVGLLFVETLAPKVKKVLVLEPTRILVEQTYDFYRRYSDLDVGMYHGLVKDESALKRKVLVTTPESALALGLFDVDVVVVDECHHAVGEDPLRKFLEKVGAKYRLGLSAHIPSRHRKVIQKLIGPIREWRYDDPLIRPYVAQWVAEVYEAPFDEEERSVYDEIEGLRTVSEGREKILYRLALTYLSRDGALALKESISKKTKLAALLSHLRERVIKLRDLHKWEILQRVLEQHDYEKALIFIDRVVVARRVAQLLGAVLITGRRSVEERKKELEEARKARILVSTSAGEEGVDLPTVDLLVIWSNASSPLRFIQRRGRALRPAGRIPKSVVFIVTPDTIDLDLFVEGVYAAKNAGVDVGVLTGLVERYARMGVRRKILEFLDEPLPEEWIAELTGLPRSTVQRHLRILCEEGVVAVVYTERGRCYLRSDLLPSFAENRPDLFQGGARIKVKTDGRKRAPPFYLRSVVVSEKRNGTEYVYTLRVNCYVKKEAWPLLRKHYSTPAVYRTWG